jgi:hypothetical protein
MAWYGSVCNKTNNLHTRCTPRQFLLHTRFRLIKQIFHQFSQYSLILCILLRPRSRRSRRRAREPDRRPRHVTLLFALPHVRHKTPRDKRKHARCTWRNRCSRNCSHSHSRRRHNRTIPMLSHRRLSSPMHIQRSQRPSEYKCEERDEAGGQAHVAQHLAPGGEELGGMVCWAADTRRRRRRRSCGRIWDRRCS